MGSQRVFTRECKLGAIKELESGSSVGLIARRLEIDRNTLYRWRREFKESATKAFPGKGKGIIDHEAELERKIGQMTMEMDFLKKLLRSFEDQQATANGVRRSTRKSRKKRK